ncbi:MAG: hypothetical protein JKY70_12365 [Mucilaginibacter sp.]|nr:hypothetical protein [Mucilaginibacter sp.]
MKKAFLKFICTKNSTLYAAKPQYYGSVNNKQHSRTNDKYDSVSNCRKPFIHYRTCCQKTDNE